MPAHPFKDQLSFLLIPILCVAFTSCGKKTADTGKEKAAAAGPAVPKVFDTLVLKNGGVIQGKIVKETPKEVLINWQGGVIGFSRAEIVEVKKGDTQVQGEGGIVIPKDESAVDTMNPANYPIVRLRNGKIMKNVSVKKEGASFLIGEKIEGGGTIDFTFAYDEIENIALWPYPEYVASTEFNKVKSSYSAFKMHEKGHYMVLSDDNPIDLNTYMRTLEQFYEEFVMFFFEFIRPDYTPKPLQAVIFGQETTFKSLLKQSGFPAESQVIGFFVPEMRILFLYNIKTNELIEKTTKQYSEYEEMIKGKLETMEQYRDAEDIDQSRYMGTGERALEELEKERLRLEGAALGETIRTIRHEGAHQLLFEFDVHAKNEKSRQGAWLVEGLASYCEPEPIGDVHLERLMHLKYELEKHQLMPLEYLVTFGAGADIHKLAPDYTGLAYAQSWAFVHFLMSGKYHDGFLKYVREVPKQGLDFDEKKDLELLQSCLGALIQDVDREFEPYVKQMIEDNVDPKKYEEFSLGMAVS